MMDAFWQVFRFVAEDKILLILFTSFLLLSLATLALAVQAIRLRLKNRRNARQWLRQQTRWQPLVFNGMTGEMTAEEIRSQIEPAHRLGFVDFVFQHAKRLSGADHDRLCRIVTPFLAPVARRITEGDTEQRARAINTLGVLNFTEYAEQIVEALDDPAPLVAMTAAWALARNGASAYGLQLVNRLDRLTNLNPTFVASLVASVGVEGAARLRQIMDDRQIEMRLRVAATEALTQLRDPWAAEQGSRILTREKADRDLFASILRLLAKTGRSQHRAVVIRFLTHEDPVLRGQAASALGHLGIRDDLPILLESLNDSSPWVALNAARGMKLIGGIESLAPILTSQHPRAELAQQVLTEEVA